MKKENKKGQITIFIILAICIVIILFLLFVKKSDLVQIFSKKSPIQDIKNCINEYATQGIAILDSQGGSINPQNFFLYNGSKVDYICYRNQYYQACVMQKPMLKEDIENELKKYLEQNTKECISNVRSSLESSGYQVIMEESPNINVELLPNDVKITYESNIQLIKDTSTEAYKNIKVDVNSKLYEFTEIASSIANWEARYGNSETMNYMYFHPDMKVEKKTRSDGTKIYILTDRNTLEQFMFATRSFAIPPGITGN